MLNTIKSKKNRDAKKLQKGKDWQAELKAAAPSGDGIVVFAIPLVSRKRAENWDTVSKNLARTIHALKQQTSTRWVAYICGQDMPEGIGFDEKVRFIKFRNPFVRTYDKGDKRIALIKAIAKDLQGQDGYYAQFDADDLLHPDTVATILADNNGRGYIIDKGIMADLAASKFARLAPPTDRQDSRPFWKVCGSCSFVRFDFRTQPRHWIKYLSTHSSHVSLIDMSRAYGLELEPIAFPAAIYTFNHGENRSGRIGRLDRRNAYIDAHHLNDQEIDTVWNDYDLSGILQQDRHPSSPTPR